MSEKHLTELPWKVLALKNKDKVKDPALQKALATYGKLDGRKMPTATVECLDTIIEQATKLKRPCAGIEELAEYLAEIIKEANKQKQALAPFVNAPSAKEEEGAKKKGEDAEGEAEEESKDFKARLLNSLKKIKTAQGEESLPFVSCVAKPFYGVLFAKSFSESIGPKHKEFLTEQTKGTKFTVGTCLWEAEAYTFVVDPVPGGLGRKLTDALKEFTGAKHRVRVRDSEGKVVVDGDTEPEVDEKDEGSDPEKKKQETELRQRMEGLRKQPVDGPYEQLKTQVLAKADDLVKQGRFPDATVLLDQYVKKVAVPITPKPPVTPTPETTKSPSSGPKLSTYMNAIKQWKDAKTAGANGIFKLKTAILNECDPELKQAVEAKINEINGILAVMDDAIIPKIQAASSEADEERQAQRNQEVAKFANTVLGTLRKHPLADVMDNNPFGAFAIRSPMESMLTKLVSDFGG
jgi:hypothetical protein